MFVQADDVRGLRHRRALQHAHEGLGQPRRQRREADEEVQFGRARTAAAELADFAFALCRKQDRVSPEAD